MPRFFASCPKGLEYLLKDELISLGAASVKEALAGVHFEGDMALGYKVCLWTRLASRILLVLAEAEIETADALYDWVYQQPWEEYMAADQTLAIHGKTSHSKNLSHGPFIAQKAKDAIVDRFRDKTGERPNVDAEAPDLSIQVRIKRQQAVLSLDMAGRSLHQRGYRAEGGKAPLKENLAAALLLRAGWPQMASNGKPFVDPMCGSGTLLIEAALMVADTAPGLLNPRYGFKHWRNFNEQLWNELIADADKRAEVGRKHLSEQPIRIHGADISKGILRIAEQNAKDAGVSEWISFHQNSVKDLHNPFPESESGLLVTNPPYGERLAEQDIVLKVYRELGDALKQQFEGWEAGVLAMERQHGQAIGLRAHKRYQLYNGSMPCELLLFQVSEQNAFEPHDPQQVSDHWDKHLSEGAQMLRNRLEKNKKRLKSYLKQHQISCYRLYDADLPEYAAAVDVYENWLHIQEYRAPATVPEATARKRLQEIVRVASGVMQIPEVRIAVKTRQKQKGQSQYERQRESGQQMEVHENGLSYWVNLQDYLDTGLFLDHREARRWVKENSANKQVLNLFCYTGSVSVAAAAGGAACVTSVDMSNTYLNWAKDNFRLNDIWMQDHEFVRANCMEWLEQNAGQEAYDLIFLDPPTFSNSKRMEEVFDIQRDHAKLIEWCLSMLSPGGTLIFSTNSKKFKLELPQLEGVEWTETTPKTMPLDFAKGRGGHKSWQFKKSGELVLEKAKIANKPAASPWGRR